MRYKPEHKQATHARILQAALGLFRHEGFAGASVEKVMRAAGLTVGGFYAHFTSKDALLAEALAEMFRVRREAWLAGLEELRGSEWLSHFARRYLSRHNRDHASGCAVPSLLSDLTRAEPEAQGAVVDGFEPLLAELQARLPEREGLTPRQQALATLSLLIGALSLARATTSRPFSDEVLRAALASLEKGHRAGPAVAPVPGGKGA